MVTWSYFPVSCLSLPPNDVFQSHTFLANSACLCHLPYFCWGNKAWINSEETRKTGRQDRRRGNIVKLKTYFLSLRLTKWLTLLVRFDFGKYSVKWVPLFIFLIECWHDLTRHYLHPVLLINFLSSRVGGVRPECDISINSTVELLIKVLCAEVIYMPLRNVTPWCNNKPSNTSIVSQEKLETLETIWFFSPR